MAIFRRFCAFLMAGVLLSFPLMGNAADSTAFMPRNVTTEGGGFDGRLQLIYTFNNPSVGLTGQVITLSGLTISKPMYFLHDARHSNSAHAYIGVTVISGAANLRATAYSHFGYLLGPHAGTITGGNSCMLIPTSSTVRFKLYTSNGASTLRIYQ